MKFIIGLIERCLDWDDRRRVKKCLDKCRYLAQDPQMDKDRLIEVLENVLVFEEGGAAELADYILSTTHKKESA